MKREHNKILMVLFLVYLAALTWIILFKMEFSMGNLVGVRSINMIPFQGSMIVNGKIAFSEIIQNAFAFIPFGIYVSTLWKEWSFPEKFLSFALVSLIYEVLQYILAIGRSDITDVINNCLGGLFGMGIYFILRKLFHSDAKTEKFISICAGIMTAGMLVLLTLLVAVNR